MEITELLIILVGIAGLWVLYAGIRNTIDDIQTIRRCTVRTTAEILSWGVEEDSDNPTVYIPTIRYCYDGQVYETEFLDASVTRYQKERDYAGTTMAIFLNGADPAVITPENKHRSIFRSIENCVVVSGICLFFILMAVMLFLHEVI